MEISIEFVGSTARTKFNKDDFLLEIQAEIEKLKSANSSIQVSKETKQAPSGAQGAEELIVWLVELAANPDMIPAYLKAFSAAINEICRSRGQVAQIPETNEIKDADNGLDLKPKDYLLSLKAAGKAMTLPATAAALKKFVTEVIGGQ
jgi:hypothetical protein